MTSPGSVSTRTTARVLVLCGTAEARALCVALAERTDQFDAHASLAGRTADPQPLPLPTRVGGFGGADGLAAYLRNQRIDALVDATHPFAAGIAANAARACLSASVPRVVLARAVWTATSGDQWVEVDSPTAAATHLPTLGRNAFLALGRQHLSAFVEAVPSPMRYVARSTETHPPDGLPDALEWRCQRGPFDAVAEAALFRDREIDVIVCRNSGGDAGYPKLAAARTLGLPVLVIRRPTIFHTDDAPHFTRVADVLVWLRSLGLTAALPQNRAL